MLKSTLSAIALMATASAHAIAGETPISFDVAEDITRFVLAPTIEKVLSEVDQLPDAACPDGEAVIALTLHPSYPARSYHTSGILREPGLRQVGSREGKVEPLRL